jgi:hypothetical protein
MRILELLPNPDNKYLVSFFMSVYDPTRIIVIRGKMPGFPDTYNGAPVSKPAPGFDTIQLRYWSMCLGNLVSPLPIEGCAVDATTPLDENGFYTLVISNDVLRPGWLPPQVVWLPWGGREDGSKNHLFSQHAAIVKLQSVRPERHSPGLRGEFQLPNPQPTTRSRKPANAHRM